MYSNGVIIILNKIWCILSLTLLGHKFGIVKIRHFWGKSFSLKSWSCKKNTIKNVCRQYRDNLTGLVPAYRSRISCSEQDIRDRIMAELIWAGAETAATVMTLTGLTGV